MAYAYWSIEDKATFDAQYGNGLVLPEAGAISQKQAEALAREEMKMH